MPSEAEAGKAVRAAAFAAEVGAAAVVFQFFVALYLVLWLVVPPTAAEVALSDPLVQLLRPWCGLWGIPALCVLMGAVWAVLRPPSSAALGAALRGFVAAIAVVAFGLPLLRLVAGPSLPAFIPPEESARPGMLLGVGAGILEEAVFRLALLSSLYLVLLRRCSPARAQAAAVAATALAFALSHEIGPGAGPFVAAYFAARFVVPGCVMGALFFRPGPAFLVSLHSAAHVGIALLFT